MEKMPYQPDLDRAMTIANTGSGDDERLARSAAGDDRARR